MRIGRVPFLAVALTFSGQTLSLARDPKPAAMHRFKAVVLFETNLGQADPGVDYVCSGVNRWYSISRRGATLQLATPLHIRFSNANSAARHEGLDPQSSGSNYMIGDNPQGWLMDVPTYGRVHYRQIWPGVDVVYYGREERLEYDFVVAPHADIRAIKVAFEGAEALLLNSAGDLEIKVAGTKVTQRRPNIFQIIDGRRVSIAGRYHVGMDRKVGSLGQV